MTLLWFDGFESYNDAVDMYALDEYNYIVTNGFSSSYGRNGRGMYHYYTNAGTRWVAQNTLSENGTLIIGFAMKHLHTGNFVYNSSDPLLRIYDNASDYNTHVRFHGKDGTRVIEVRDNAGNVLGTGTIEIPYNTWVYVEFKVVIHDSAGIVQTKINGVLDIDISGQDTLNGSNAYCGSVLIRPVATYGSYYWDDFYICNGQGTKNNDFLGDIRIDPLRPNGAGTYTDFTPSAGSNYQNVDETYPDDDTTYNDGASVADQDSYALENLPSPASTTIHGVKSQITVRKTDAGAMECKILTRAGTTDDLGDTINLSDSFVTYTKILEDNPDDSAAWEDADVNGMEVGVEITA